jgi:hypothetical protein
MPGFYNAETREPIRTMYISSSGNANVVLSSFSPSKSMMSLPQRPYVVVSNGKGVATPDLGRNPKPWEYRWKFSGLTPGSSITALVGKDEILAEIPVKSIADAGSYKPIMKRFNSRGMEVDLDKHIDYVCYASDILGEGISFRPKNAAEFKSAITDTQLFHRDDRADFFGKKAASATIGEGYREVSTPSLHVAIDSEISSVHVDSYAFQFHAPDGTIIIGPDAGQHIADELLFRLPMNWLRRKNMTFMAAVLQALHPVLPHSLNGYAPRLGIRVELGGSGARDLRSGSPRLSFEATVDFTLNTTQRFKTAAELRLLSGGNTDKNPDWVLSLKAEAECRDAGCRDHQETVGLYFTTNRL